MPTSTGSVQGLTRDVVLGEDAESDMRQVDRCEIDAVCRHLLGTAWDSVVRPLRPASEAGR